MAEINRQFIWGSATRKFFFDLESACSRFTSQENQTSLTRFTDTPFGKETWLIWLAVLVQGWGVPKETWDTRNRGRKKRFGAGGKDSTAKVLETFYDTLFRYSLWDCCNGSGGKGACWPEFDSRDSHDGSHPLTSVIPLSQELCQVETVWKRK